MVTAMMRVKEPATRWRCGGSLSLLGCRRYFSSEVTWAAWAGAERTGGLADGEAWKLRAAAAAAGVAAAAAASATGRAVCEQEEKGAESGGDGVKNKETEAPISNKHTARWRIFTDRARGLAASARARNRDEGIDKGKLKEALGLMKAALDEAIQGFGEDDPHVAAAMSNLAEVNRIMGDFEAAEELYMDAIRRLEGIYGSAEALDAGAGPTISEDDSSAGMLHPSIGAALHNLGGFYLYTQDGQKAEVVLRRALKAKLFSVGRGHPEYARSLFFLSEALRIQHGPCDAAVSVLQEGIDTMSKLGAGNTDATLRQMVRLVELLCQCGRCAEAETLVHRTTAVIRGASFPTQVQSGAMDRMLRAIGEACGSSHYQRQKTV